MNHPHSTPRPRRPRFILTLEPVPRDRFGREPYQRLRAGLKRLLRDQGLRCVELRVHDPADAKGAKGKLANAGVANAEAGYKPTPSSRGGTPDDDTARTAILASNTDTPVTPTAAPAPPQRSTP